MYIDPGNPASYSNVGTATNFQTIVNLTNSTQFTHWEPKVDDGDIYDWQNGAVDNSDLRPDFEIYNDGDGIVHNPGYSWELLNGATEGNSIHKKNSRAGISSGWPINSSSVSMWVKESDWSDFTNVFKMESGDNSDKDLFYSEGGVWKRKLNALNMGGGGAATYNLGNNTLTPNQWHHIVATRDVDGGPGTVSNTGIIKLYVDGVLTSTVTGTQNGTMDSTIQWKTEFGRGGGNTGKFVGEYGPIRIFHVELTQSEVEYEYDMFALRYKPAGFSATPGGLSINSAGIIDVSASASGTYVVLATWTEPTSGKTHTASSTVTIGDSDASFNYPLPTTYCQSDVSVISPTITGDSGGVFSAPRRLDIKHEYRWNYTLNIYPWDVYCNLHNRCNMF